MFSQEENFNTNYLHMEIALTYLKAFAQENKLSIAIPRNIGNGIANGIDGMAEKVIRKVFKNTDLEVAMYEL